MYKTCRTFTLLPRWISFMIHHYFTDSIHPTTRKHRCSATITSCVLYTIIFLFCLWVCKLECLKMDCLFQFYMNAVTSDMKIHWKKFQFYLQIYKRKGASSEKILRNEKNVYHACKSHQSPLLGYVYTGSADRDWEIFAHLFLKNCSSSILFSGKWQWTALLKSIHWFTIGFKSGLWLGHSRTFTFTFLSLSHCGVVSENHL